MADEIVTPAPAAPAPTIPAKVEEVAKEQFVSAKTFEALLKHLAEHGIHFKG